MDEKAAMLERLRALRDKTDTALGGVSNEQMTVPVQMRPARPETFGTFSTSFSCTRRSTLSS